MNTFVTVIIPTFRDWKRLAICLTALSNQTIGLDNFEIIVVNNDIGDIQPIGYSVPGNCKIILEAQPGSYSARNTGLINATGNILAFTDSDCIPDRDWLKNSVKNFEANESIDLIAGRIKLFFKGEEKSLAELYESVYAFRQDIEAKKGVCVTGNLIVRKRVFDSIGSFNVGLFSGGDYEWTSRATKAGFKMLYCEDVMIEHPARYKVEELIKKEKRKAGSLKGQKKRVITRAIKYLVPPINTILHGSSLGLLGAFKVFLLRYRLNIIRSVEEVRVCFGKAANRE